MDEVARTQVIVAGASGFGRQIADYLQDADSEVAGFVDDDPAAHAPTGYKLLGTIRDLSVQANSIEVLIAVAEPDGRKAIAEQMLDCGIRLHTLVHPTAYVARDAQIGAGCVICPNANLGTGSVLGENVLVNTNALIGHDSRIGAHSALMTLTSIGGGSSLGVGVFVGTHASVNPNRNVGSGSKIAAGSVVYQNMPEGVLVSGNPAKALPLVKLDPR